MFCYKNVIALAKLKQFNVVLAFPVWNVCFTFADPIEGSDEVVIADDGQSDEGVDTDDDVEEESAMLAEGRTQERSRELLDGRGRAIDPPRPECWHP